MIRLVLAVVLATALLAASMPAVDSARADRTVTHLDADIAAIHEAATGLVDHEDPTGPDTLGARRVVAVHLPHRSWTMAAVDTVTVTGRESGDGDGATARVDYTLENGRQRRVRLAVPFETPDGPLVLAGSGTHRLVLTLTRDDSVPVVVARRG